MSEVCPYPVLSSAAFDRELHMGYPVMMERIPGDHDRATSARELVHTYSLQVRPDVLTFCDFGESLMAQGKDIGHLLDHSQRLYVYLDHLLEGKNGMPDHNLIETINFNILLPTIPWHDVARTHMLQLDETALKTYRETDVSWLYEGLRHLLERVGNIDFGMLKAKYPSLAGLIREDSVDTSGTLRALSLHWFEGSFARDLVHEFLQLQDFPDDIKFGIEECVYEHSAHADYPRKRIESRILHSIDTVDVFNPDRAHQAVEFFAGLWGEEFIRAHAHTLLRIYLYLTDITISIPELAHIAKEKKRQFEQMSRKLLGIDSKKTDDAV